MNDVGFAVVDLETTGFNARGHDRIVEVAVVHVDGGGRITGTWETLVNPRRDLGPVSVHRVRAAEVRRAPTFDQIAGQLVSLLRGRVIAAHNAGFECRFLRAEFERLGLAVPALDRFALCTMQLASEFLPGAGRSLADCCAAIDVEIGEAHRASADAIATAKLLAAYLQQDPHAPFWRERAQAARSVAWPPLREANVEWVRRGEADRAAPHFLQRIAEGLPPFAGPAEQNEYLALLDRCLLDRHLSEHEKDALVDLAEELRIPRSACEALHLQYFEALARVAWADHHLTADEKHELESVAVLLAIPPNVLAAALAGPPPDLPSRQERKLTTDAFRLEPGDKVVLTGEMRRPREEWHRELERLGFVPWGAVTRQVKLLAAADPDSLSGKARKARDYGIPIVDERGLETLIRATPGSFVTAPGPTL